MSSSRIMGKFRRGLGVLFGFALAFLPGIVNADWGYNFQEPVTKIAEGLYDLHTMIFIICVVIFIGVFAVMFYSIIKHRKSKGHAASNFHEHTGVEVVWTLIPFVILVGMAIPSTAMLLKMEDTSNPELTVKITGYQWKWEYEYMDSGIKFFSNLSTPQEQITNAKEKGENYLLETDTHLVLPVGKKVRFLLTANDVIHAWWVPQLGVKKDAIPGFINEMWTKIDKPGTYRGQCAELCGKDHGFMPIVVEAVSDEKFKSWVNGQKKQQVAEAASADKTWTQAELMAKGKQVYGQCLACHGANGQGVPNVFPALKDSKIALGPIEAHLDIVLNGKPGTAMQAFAKQLSDVDIAAVVTYERNSFGNKVGDMVQPSAVKALRK